MKLLVENLYFFYSKHQEILQGIDLKLEDAEIMCLVGPNGSGKSTLVKCIDALHKPSRGKITIDDVDLHKISRRALALKIGYVPQTSRQLFSSTVFDTVLMGRNPHFSQDSNEEDIDITIDTLLQMGLSTIAMNQFNQLSGGQQQRVLIARALAQKPELLLLDEPTSALDIAHQLEVMDMITDIVLQRKISVLMVVHDLNLASRYADRIVMLDHGVICKSGKPEEVLTASNIAQVFGVESHIDRYKDKRIIVPVERISPDTPCY